MRTDCHGDYFKTRTGHIRYYCCFYDSSIFPALVDMPRCPGCGRPIVAEDRGIVRSTTLIHLPGRGLVKLWEDAPVS